jgi:hypothetical protein
VKRIFLVLFAIGVGATLSHFGPDLVRAAGHTVFAFPAPDPDPRYVKPPKPGQSYACDPLANSNVFDDRFTHKATVWANQSVPKVAVRVSNDGKQLLLMIVGVTDPQEFKITSNTSYYLMAEERLITLGVALIIFDARTMKMLWSFNGEGMLGIKGESVLYQCR